MQRIRDRNALHFNYRSWTALGPGIVDTIQTVISSSQIKLCGRLTRLDLGGVTADLSSRQR